MMENQVNNPPSAFIKDPKTMDHLIERWRKYARTESRSYGRIIGRTDSDEVFDENPSIRPDFLPYRNYTDEPDLLQPFKTDSYGVDGRFTLVDTQVPRLFRESAERMHGVNFFNEIQNRIDEKKSKNDAKPVGILVTGSDLGFFNDELRTKFGNTVDVYGTTVELSRSRVKKRRFVESIRSGKIKLPPELQKYLAESLSNQIDPRDAKWRSILQMQSDKPEFDMIIDTCGELLYAFDEQRPDIFELTFTACIAKLNPGGKLYIAELDYKARKIVEAYCAEHNLILEKKGYENRHQHIQTNFVITKPL